MLIKTGKGFRVESIQHHVSQYSKLSNRVSTLIRIVLSQQFE